MPTVGKKKYPYTPAGKAAAKKAARGIGRSAAQIKKMKGGMKRASAKRKAGKGYKKQYNNTACLYLLSRIPKDGQLP